MPLDEEAEFACENIKCPECGSLDTYPEMGGSTTDLIPTYWAVCNKCKHEWNHHQ